MSRGASMTGSESRAVAVTVGLCALALTLGACSSGATSDASPSAVPGPTGPELIGPAPADATVPVIVRLAQQVPESELPGRVAAIGVDGPGSSAAKRRLVLAAGADDATIAGVVTHFAGQGLEAAVDPTRTYAHLAMNSAQASDLLGVELSSYRERRAECDPAKDAVPSGCNFVAPAPAASIRIPGDLSPFLIQGAPDQQIVGFSDRQILRHGSVDSRSAGPSPASAITDALDPNAPPWWNASGTPSGCSAAKTGGGFTPNQLAATYGFPAPVGKLVPQTVALIAMNQSVDQVSLATFAKCFGLKLPTVVVDGPAPSQPSGGEATGDAQILAAIGGSAIGEIHVVTGTEGAASATDLLSALARATTLTGSDGKPVDIVSSSYAACETQFLSAFGSTIPVTETVLAKAAAAGVSVMSASGDAGSSACAPNGGTDTAPAVNYPASSASVTAVGGTNLLLNPDNSIRYSGVWNDAGLVQSGSQIEPFAGGGGGVSSAIERPDWQAGPGVDPDAKRQVPDVAYVADMYPGIAAYCTSAVRGCLGVDWFPSAGTSLATPMFAAAVAQFNARHDGSRLGFVNPKLYPAVASGKVKTYDIVSGNNVVGFSTSGTGVVLPPLGCCTAAPHFDPASGWGSVNIQSMLSGLS